MSSKKLPVSINVFPSLDYVELIQFDERSGEIEKTSALPCQFDATTRQMGDRDLMMQTIKDLYTMNRIAFNTPAVLILPSFFTREIELPAEFSREELRFALISEAERFYVFKKMEPQIGWINLDESRLLYSAYPKLEIEKYMKIFQELRIPLLSIDLSYFSMLRGLVATGAVSSEVENTSRWCVLVISDNSFFASIQDGVKIFRSADAPLSITEEDDQFIVQEIQQDFETFAENEVFDKLVVVNNSNRINSNDLLCRLTQVANMILIEQNGTTLKSRGSVEAQFPCSLEGLGGVFYKHFPEMPGLNFILETGEDIAGIMYYKKEAIKWLLISNGVVFIICLFILGVLSLMTFQKDQERQMLSEKAAKLGASINAEQLNEVNQKKYIKKVVDQNVKVNNFLVKLGSIIQKDIWLEKIQLAATKLDDPLQVQVEGKALSLDEVNALLTPLNNSLKSGNLEVSTAAQATSAEGQAYFTWSIQNKGSEAKNDGSSGTTNQPAPIMAPPNAPVTNQGAG
jgi:hypothetical protein